MNRRCLVVELLQIVMRHVASLLVRVTDETSLSEIEGLRIVTEEVQSRCWVLSFWVSLYIPICLRIEIEHWF
jgi:hypothetical protein